MSERHGLGIDECEGSAAHRGVDGSSGRAAKRSFGCRGVGDQRPPGKPVAVRYRDGGALIHRARGRASNNQLETGVRDYAVQLIRQSYRDFGPTLATESLQERHGITIGRETVRKWVVADGLWLLRKQRRTFHQPRLRRESYGELVQIDGSDHRWFQGRGEPCTLLVFIDDATGRLMQLRFVPSESTDSYFAARWMLMATL